MSKIAPCLLFEKEAEEAAKFYTSLLPNSKIVHVQRNVMDSAGGKEGTVLIVEFTIAGQKYQALNCGAKIEHTHAISFSVECEDQAEVDRLWDKLSSDGGEVIECSWVKDRYGVSWQVVPKVMMRMLADPDKEKAKRAMAAMLKMKKLDIATLQRAYEGKAA
jgi:predicted 3-demethylubiquinone-9 3-methyltransferase (glyoxalase superfamily)